jgi:hypothetical protein
MIRAALVILVVVFFLALLIVIQTACLLIDANLNFRSGRWLDQLIVWSSVGISAIIADWMYRWAADLWIPLRNPTVRVLEPDGEGSASPPVLEYSRIARAQTKTPIQATLSYVAGTAILLLGIFSVVFRHFGLPGFWFLAPLAVAGIVMGIWNWNRTRFSVAKIGANFAALGAALMLLAKLRG